MNILSFPPQLPPPTFTPGQSFRDLLANEQAHTAKLAHWLRASGWRGPHTGKTVRFPIAEGYAIYMLADGETPALMHLAYGDSFTYPEARLISREDILARIDEQRRADAAIFASPLAVAA